MKNIYISSNNECIIKDFNENTKIDEFRNQIIKDIGSYVNSSKVINGSNFHAVILTSDDFNPEEQFKKGISTFNLGNCTNVLKEYYDIPKEENLIIMNLEIIEDKINENKRNLDNDKSFNLGKSTQIEIYDNSGRKLNLSICKEDIKIMKYIGDIKKLDIITAKALSTKGIDVFNAADDFFNDLCCFYNSSDGIDINIDDRRNDIYQNATFCNKVVPIMEKIII